MKIKNLILTIVAGAAIVFTGCKKEGCTDKDAVNFCDECKKDDGTCTYKGNIVFWYNSSTSAALVNDGAVSLTYYVDGQIVGSSAANVYYTSAPNCNQGGVTVEKDLGKSRSKGFSYSVKDQTGWEYYSGTVTFTANTCTTYQLQ